MGKENIIIQILGLFFIFASIYYFVIYKKIEQLKEYIEELRTELAALRRE